MFYHLNLFSFRDGICLRNFLLPADCVSAISGPQILLLSFLFSATLPAERSIYSPDQYTFEKFSRCLSCLIRYERGGEVAFASPPPPPPAPFRFKATLGLGFVSPSAVQKPLLPTFPNPLYFSFISSALLNERSKLRVLCS